MLSVSGQKRVICWLLERGVSRNWCSACHSCLTAKEEMFPCNNQEFITSYWDLVFLQYFWVRSAENRSNYYVQIQKLTSHSYNLHSSIHSYKMPHAFSAHTERPQIQTNISKAWVAFTRVSLKLRSPSGNMLYECTYMSEYLVYIQT